MSSLPKILLLYAHPESPDSVVNQALLRSAQRLPHVTVHDLYAQYPDFFIDVHHEQQLLCEHQVIVFQHPLYTYSCPALMKEWMDRVLVRGFISGHGEALRGRFWRSVVTTGEPEAAYRMGGHHRYPIDDILRPFELTAAMCHMHWLTPMVFYQARHQNPEALRHSVERYTTWLSSPLHHRGQ